MKSALFAAIFGITMGIAMLLAEDKHAAVKFRQARAEMGLPPQRETEPYVIPEPVRYSSVWRYAAGAQVTQAKAKPEKRAPQRRRHVARSRPNFLQRLFASFINPQKHQAPKTPRKRFPTTSRLNKKRLPQTPKKPLQTNVFLLTHIAATESVSHAFTSLASPSAPEKFNVERQEAIG
jgi:hypothetical protein